MTVRIAIVSAALLPLMFVFVSVADGEGDSVLLSSADRPWKVWSAEGIKTPCGLKDGWLTAKVRLDAKSRKIFIRLDLADIPGLAACAPVAVEEFDVTVDVPKELMGSRNAPSGHLLFWTDENWKWHEPKGGGWRNVNWAGKHRLNLARNALPDTTAIGLCFSLNDRLKIEGVRQAVLRVRVNKLKLRPSVPAAGQLPKRGQTERSLLSGAKWAIDPNGLGIDKVAASPKLLKLTCDLDSANPRKRNGIIRTAIPLTDMRSRGVFVTVTAPEALVAKSKFKCGLQIGLYNGKRVFWGTWRSVLRAGKVTVALHPEVRFPLPMAYRSEGFDPSRVDALAIRVTCDAGASFRYGGPLEVTNVELVTTSPILLAEREAVAERLLKLQVRPGLHKATTRPTRLAEFTNWVGVNYPWPVDESGQGIYPPVGAKVYTAAGKVGGLALRRKAIASDFKFLSDHGVSVVRVWLMGDLRRGVYKDKDGLFVLEKQCLEDLDILLSEASKANIQLIPVLLDFLVADGNSRERLAKIGEEAAIFTDAKVREQFLDCVEPILARLCKSSSVRLIDICNEPGQMVVPMDSVVATIQSFRRRIKTLGAKPVTVGARDSTELLFWIRSGIDVPTFHWFDKLNPGAHGLTGELKGLDRGSAIVTEVEVRGSVDETLERIRLAGYKGALIWSMHGNDGVSPFGKQQAKQLLRFIKQRR